MRASWGGPAPRRPGRQRPVCAEGWPFVLCGPSAAHTMAFSDARGELGCLGFWGEGGPSGLGLSAPSGAGPVRPTLQHWLPCPHLGVYLG